MAPSISIREYIRWSPEPASEPTTTVVLTSAESRFVDIRLLNPTPGSYSERHPECKCTTSCIQAYNAKDFFTDPLHSSQIDWAFAGTSSSEIRVDANGAQTVHSTWRHWVDSRFPTAEDVKDEGDMFPLADGRTLENGSMINPATGRMTDYEECWKDVDPLANEKGAGKVCTVLQIHDDAHKVRGMVFRVGQFCQGILRVGEGLSLERWQWEESGGWKRQARVGDQWIPCGVILEGERLKMGGEVTYGDFVWRVVELGEF